ncbi:TPA: DNA polymerase III subunit delta [Salmonella enterica subsp. enterica serovar Typhi str. AG3]|nr:DNA polymerase III subunit delta [Salmonella enterica subsp. enterica serovar Typhi str. AG3]
MVKVILVHGEEQLLCDEYVKKITPEDVMSLERFDMQETDIEEALMTAAQGSLFGGDDKTVILNDCSFLGTEKGLTDKETSFVLEFLNNKDLPATIVFRYRKLDKRKKLVKALIKMAEVFEGKPIKYPQKWLIDRAKGYGLTLANGSVEKMIVDVGINLYLLDSELIKIKSRYLNEKVITPEMLEDVLSRTLESDVFKLIDYIINRQASAIELLGDLLKTGSDEIQILLLIARQLRMIEQIKIAEETNIPVEQFISVHSFVLQKAKEQADEYSLEEVQQKMSQVAQLDLKMKRGQVEKTTALETLILQWM